MPRLSVFAACKEVLLDDLQNPSLISVFTSIETAHTKGEKIAPNAVAPMHWTVFTMWKGEQSDIGKEFTQHLVIIAPNGLEYGNSVTTFIMEKLSHTVRIKVQGLPAGVEGDILLKAWLQAGEHKITNVYKSEINIKHAMEPPRETTEI